MCHLINIELIDLLHITAHLGGGVGKVLSRLVAASKRRQDGVRHTVVCLEPPEKSQFADHIQANGGELRICPSQHELQERIRQADIVQLEWWHHPIVAGWLCSGELPAMRLVIWSHVSGLHPPVIPPAFLKAPHRFLFTSPCSWEHPDLAKLDRQSCQHVDVVFSSGGFDDLPPPPVRAHNRPLRPGYVGTLNYAKLHPGLLDFLSAVRLPDFKLALVGDPTTGESLLAEACARGIAGRLEVRGYCQDVASQLSSFDVLVYLLNPLHYGTTENALLEAMAMGVVPVVLDNPAERVLIRHGETGLIVHDPQSFAEAIDWLACHPEEKKRLSGNAAREVRERFAIDRTADALMGHYRAVLAEAKRTFDFRPVFGDDPADWFKSCQGEEAWRFTDGQGIEAMPRGPHYLYEKTKSSVFHFRDCYPADARLARWARQLEVKAC